MNSVWLVFKLFETLFGLICLGYHTRGFLNIDFVQSHYTYCFIFGGTTLMSMFGSIAICLKETSHPLWEGGMNSMAALCLFGVSLDSMFHAEKDFYLTYLASMENIDDDPPYPFFKHSKVQSIAALCSGCLYLLHSILAFDLCFAEDADRGNVGASDCREEDSGENGIVHQRLYVCGKGVHKWLEKYEWFTKLD
ncbi:uncharacterized protein LOC142229949 [Haematobia irritans]|uniref:uncharacterized protein LOC142229949 n=1 Tax=Haematobia irritans TaxID=7368 RepID=UPI003F50CF6A